MVDVDLVHEHRVSKQARETSKHAIDRIWLSHAFLKLALAQNILVRFLPNCRVLTSVVLLPVKLPSFLLFLFWLLFT